MAPLGFYGKKHAQTEVEPVEDHVDEHGEGDQEAPDKGEVEYDPFCDRHCSHSPGWAASGRRMVSSMAGVMPAVRVGPFVTSLRRGSSKTGERLIKRMM